MQFLAKILSNNRFLPETQGLAPPLPNLGIPGSTTDTYEECLYFSGADDIILLLIERGCDIHVRDSKGKHALHCCSRVNVQFL